MADRSGGERRGRSGTKGRRGKMEETVRIRSGRVKKSVLFANYSFFFFSLTNQLLSKKKKKNVWHHVKSRGNKSHKMVSTLAHITLRAAALSINLPLNSSRQIHLKSSGATRHILPTLFIYLVTQKQREVRFSVNYNIVKMFHSSHVQCSKQYSGENKYSTCIHSLVHLFTWI